MKHRGLTRKNGNISVFSSLTGFRHWPSFAHAMGNYDKIMRENLGTVSRELLKSLLHIDAEEIVPVTPRVRKTIFEKETDNLFLVKPVGSAEFILHLEFQSTNDPQMPSRVAMYNYAVSYMRKKTVVSVVIYVGREKMTMKSFLSSDGNYFKFKLIDIHDFDPDLFVNSRNPKEIILAVLAGKDEHKRKLIINEIFNKLRQLTTSESELSERLQELEIISILRGADIQQLVINKKETMPIIIDIREDLRFKQGKEEGKIEGKAEGLFHTAETMLREGVPVPLVSKYTGLSLAEVGKIAQRLSKH